jgi:hypothetical protein
MGSRLSFSILFSLLVLKVSAQWLGFELHQEIATQQRLHSFSVAQADGDGIRDIIAFATDHFDAVNLFKGNSDTRFEDAGIFSKQEQYRLLNTGDLDNDGVDDLVLSSYWGNGFKIYWGSEDGVYHEGQHYGLTGHGKNLVIEDLNNDGATDVAALSGGSGQPITLHLFTGNSSRALTPAGVYSSIVHTDRKITVLDKNNDGRKDLMVASSFPWFVIFYQEEDGSFTPRYWPHELTLPYTSDYHLVDLNNDTHEDIVAYYYEEKALRIYAGKQDTFFSETYSTINLEHSPGENLMATDIALQDINGDGNADIFFRQMTDEFEPTDKFIFMPGNGDLTFQNPVSFDAGSIVERFILEDFNGDSFPDIIFYSPEKKLVTLLNGGITTGVEEPALQVSSHPNPFGNTLVINTSDAADLDIYTMHGQRVISRSDVKNIELDTGDWKPGIYLLTTHVNGKRATKKLIKI